MGPHPLGREVWGHLRTRCSKRHPDISDGRRASQLWNVNSYRKLDGRGVLMSWMGSSYKTHFHKEHKKPTSNQEAKIHNTFSFPMECLFGDTTSVPGCRRSTGCEFSCSFCVCQVSTNVVLEPPPIKESLQKDWCLPHSQMSSGLGGLRDLRSSY